MPRRTDRSGAFDRLVAATAARLRPDRWRSPVVRRALRHRIAAWTAAVAVALGVWSTVADANDTRRRWEPVEVLVAGRTLEPGDQLDATDVRRTTWPRTQVPDEALDAAPVGARVTATIVAGEVLVGRRFAEGSGSTAARLGADRAAVSLPLGASPPPLAVGDRVDVVAPVHGVGDWATEGSGPRVAVVASAAEVIEVGDGNATVAVERDEVAATTAAILDGALTVVLRS